MRKLIEKTQENLIVCDGENCEYEIPWSEEGEKNITSYINRPCPLCGENLLTIEDYTQYQKIMKSVNWVNKWFSWITIFMKKNPKTHSVSVHVHNGVKIENADCKETEAHN